MVTLLQELVLLAIEDDGNVAFTAGSPGFAMSVIGACLVELNQRGRIDADLDTLTVLSTEPTGDASLDLVLRELAKGPAHSVAEWAPRLIANANLIVKQAIDSLTKAGILEAREARFLWVLKSRRYPVIDGREQKEAKLRIVSTLLGNDLPTPHDTVLIALAQAGGLLEAFLSDAEVTRLQGRIDEVGGIDLIVRGIEAAIRKEQADRARMMMMMPVH